MGAFLEEYFVKGSLAFRIYQAHKCLVASKSNEKHNKCIGLNAMIQCSQYWVSALNILWHSTAAKNVRRERKKICFPFFVSLYKTRFHASGRRLHIYYNRFACDQMILLCKVFFVCFISLFIPQFFLKFFFTPVFADTSSIFSYRRYFRCDTSNIMHPVVYVCTVGLDEVDKNG